MIKFFRKIRYDLMETGKTGKYFKYAIGEIVLVVIGILIALSINNWNEHKKNLAKKEMLLIALQTEFTSNLAQMKKVLFHDERVAKGTKKLLQLDAKNSIEVTNDSLSKWLRRSSTRWTFNPLNGALRSGISSGEIHLIQNDSLVNLLFGWQDFVADAREDEERAVTALIAANPMIQKHIRYVDYKNIYFFDSEKSEFTSDFQSLFRDPMFEDYLGERHLSITEAIGALMRVREKNILILKIIANELATN